ncbi:hypothetical protein NLJ89_g4841 [Agrocybe chaxingu]|uniref:Uncharacterized protein n=1 Tax=Agrocybe chaxingu TaxID=84603 RepID=A0A9W8MW56_9AGAR|nr:hypothetical protein NLJ89_g4841 [Agrocybe chaxingu]
MESRTSVGNHTYGSAVYRTLYHSEAFKADLNLAPSSTSELNTFDHPFPNSPAALYQMTEPSMQLFLPYHTAPRSTYHSPSALPDTVLTPSTLPVNSSDSTQDLICAPSSSRSGVRTFHDQQLLETGYYATSQYPESSSWITSAPRQYREASTASFHNGGSVAGATAVEPSSTSDASLSASSHYGATHWYNPQQLSGEWTCGNSIASAPLTDAPTWTEMQANPSSSADYSTSTSGAQWKTNQTTGLSFEHSSAPNVDRNAHRSIHLGFSPSNFDVDFGLNPEEGDHLAPGSFASPGNITSVRSSSPVSPAPTASSSSATRQSSQPYTRSTKETKLPSCSERRTKLVFCCKWDGCEEACNGLRAFKEHLKKVHKLPVGNSSTKNTKTCLWKGCGEPHIPDRGLFRHLCRALGVVVKCTKCTTWDAPRDDDTVLGNHLMKCWKGVVPDPSAGDVWEEVYKSGDVREETIGANTLTIS